MKKLSIFIVLSMLTATICHGAEMDLATKNIIVKGTAEGTNSQVATILIQDTEGNAAYINEVDIVDKEYFAKFKFPDYTGGKYTIKVWAGGEDITSDALVAESQDGKFELKLGITGDGSNKYFTAGDTLKLNAEIKNLFADEEVYKLYLSCYAQDGRFLGVKSSNDIYITYGGNGEVQEGNFENVTLPAGTSYVKVMALTDQFTPFGSAKTQAADDKMYQDGDGVAIVGDSMAHMGDYNMFLEHFYQTRYPDRKISFYKKGVSGQTVNNALNRFDSDIVAEGANRITLMIGHNNVAERTDHDAAVAETIESMSKFLDKAEEENVEVTLITVPQSDDRESYTGYWGDSFSREPGEDYKTGTANHNEVKEKLASAVVDLARQRGVSCYDLYSLTKDINERAEAAGDRGYVLTCNDRIHACPAGDIVYAYSIIKGQGATPTVAAVELDASGTVLLTDNCKVSNVSTQNEISYTYTPFASPIGKVKTPGSTSASSEMGYEDVEKYLDLTGELNQETIKVTGLAAGEYTISLDGTPLKATYTNADLAAGVNIAILDENPNQIRAQEAWQYLIKKNSQEDKLRAIQSTIWYNGDKAYKEGTWDEWLAAKESHTYYKYFKNYPTYIEQKDSIQESALGYADQAAALSAPVSYTVTITKK